MSGWRLAQGGAIDRSKPLRFSWNGKLCSGYSGDTLASALMAAGHSVLGRSFKYHRPRGVFAAGPEDPGALVRIRAGGREEPAVPAATVELTEGLEAWPVNCWPGPNFDLGAIAQLFAPLLSAGFYYKTFKWPDWHLYEPAIRKAAGIGRVPAAADLPDYDVVHAHCDVLVVGGGPAGLAAAVAAGSRGARVLLVERDWRFGGGLLDEDGLVQGSEGRSWLEHLTAELELLPEVRLLSRTMAVGSFDHNLFLLVERDVGSAVRERLWQVRAKRAVLATGAMERPLLFDGNDRPGVMLSRSVRTYLRRFATAPGRRMAVATNNDDAYRTALVAIEAGMTVVGVADMRPAGPWALAGQLRDLGVPVLNGARLIAARGSPRLRSISVLHEGLIQLECDLLAVSGGFDANVQMHAQAGGPVEFDDCLATFRPRGDVAAQESVGAARATFNFARAVEEGTEAGDRAASWLGLAPPAFERAPPRIRGAPASLLVGQGSWEVSGKARKTFLDLQTDVTAADVELAVRENYRSLEHVKRYTTLGMGIDQGRTGAVNAVGLLARLRGIPPREVGSIRSRFPSFPVCLGTLAGPERGALFRPVRHLPLHDRHAARGASFEEHSGWLRPDSYPRTEETSEQAEQREARLVRAGAGLFDASSLGKIEIVGPDAAKFLDRVYAVVMSTLRVGRLRYGFMLNEQGSIFDDGVVARLAQDHFILFCTSGGGERVAGWLEELRQCYWRELRIIVAPVSGSWAALALAGPRARQILSSVDPDFDTSASAFPHLSFRAGRIAGISARVFRVSFTGELAYEINVPADRADELWSALTEAGAAPVGLRAWLLLRLEKGHFVVGIDTDGTTTPLDVGWRQVLNRSDFFVGAPALRRPAQQDPERLQLVGLRAARKDAIPVGAHASSARSAGGSEGFVTSSGFSPHLQRGVALAMIRGGAARHSETIRLMSGKRSLQAQIVSPVQFDREGARMRG